MCIRDRTPDPTPTEPTYTVTEASGTFYITTSGVNLRKGPGTNYDSVGSAPKDTAVKMCIRDSPNRSGKSNYHSRSRNHRRNDRRNRKTKWRKTARK